MYINQTVLVIVVRWFKNTTKKSRWINTKVEEICNHNCSTLSCRVPCPKFSMRRLYKVITSARRLCNHLGLHVCICVYVCMCICVYVCLYNSRNTKYIHTKFFECISHRLRKNWLKFGWIWLKIEREMNKILSCISRSIKKTYSWMRDKDVYNLCRQYTVQGI
jgi:hypothetical protein